MNTGTKEELVSIAPPQQSPILGDVAHTLHAAMDLNGFKDTSLPQREAQRIKLYIAEEQRILWDTYQSLLMTQPDIEVVGSSHGTDGESLVNAASLQKPDVMLLGFGLLQRAAVDKLGMIRDSCPSVGFVLLSGQYDIKGLKALRRLTENSFGKWAYLLKQSVNTTADLTRVIHLVAQDQVVVDGAVIQDFINSAEPRITFLRELSPREMEVLSLMAKGYHNKSIAAVLCLEPKMVERYIRTIYSKLDHGTDPRHPRVHAVTLYLSAAGLISGPDFGDYR